MNNVTELTDPLKFGSCTACCRYHMVVVLMPSDDVESYDYIVAPATDNREQPEQTHPEALFQIEVFKHVPVEFVKLAQERGSGFAVIELNRHENGDCVYLGKKGCTIYERRPFIC